MTARRVTAGDAGNRPAWSRLGVIAVVIAMAMTISGPIGAGGAAVESSATCTPWTGSDIGFRALWDGVSDPQILGWTQSGPGGFTVQDGSEDGSCSLLSEGGLGLLWYSAATFEDYVLRLQWRAEEDADNSGVFVRFPGSGDTTHTTAISQGYEVQIREGGVDAENQKTGSIYNAQPTPIRNARPAGEWNDYEIRVVTSPTTGLPTITATLNGLVVNTFEAWQPGRGLAGHIGLQNHGTADAISFRNLQIATLDDVDAPTTEVEAAPFGDAVRVDFPADDGAGGSGIARTEYRVDGGGWQTYVAGDEIILDETEASFQRWGHVGSGQFFHRPDGVITSLSGGGILWYPVEYGDVHLSFDWRDPSGETNSGVFIRFPDPEEAITLGEHERHSCQSGQSLTNPYRVPIHCGHEIQINDGENDPQKTGSVYNFSPIDIDGAGETAPGTWNTYELIIEGAGDYTVTVIRNGEVLNEWQNLPGLEASREGDPTTDVRQFARGYIGLQNHGFPSPPVEIRDVRVRSMDEPAPLVLSTPGTHVIEARSTDVAGNVGDVTTTEVTVGE